jgi:hypothetical protein
MAITLLIKRSSFLRARRASLCLSLPESLSWSQRICGPHGQFGVDLNTNSVVQKNLSSNWRCELSLGSCSDVAIGWDGFPQKEPHAAGAMHPRVSAAEMGGWMPKQQCQLGQRPPREWSGTTNHGKWSRLLPPYLLTGRAGATYMMRQEGCTRA